MRRIDLILLKKLEEAKNKARLIVPQNLITKFLEQSYYEIWFSYSVKEF